MSKAIVVIILLVCGALLFFCPGAMYAISQGWKNDTETDPSRAYIVSSKITGAFLFVLGVVLIVLFALGVE